MLIDPALHERFVSQFGLNMLNTLTALDRRAIARRRIHVFDERGGVMGGEGNMLQAYQNLTTGVFHSQTRKVVGVRYRCEPEAIPARALGAFHTHPARYDPDPARVRRRIEQLLWMSDLDVEAFRQQHACYGYEWHFVACVDIACFHVSDLGRGRAHPRYVLRYPHLERLMAQLEPEIQHFDARLREGLATPPRRGHRTLAGVLRDLTGEAEGWEAALASLPGPVAARLADHVLDECRLRGVRASELARLVPGATADSATPALRWRERLETLLGLAGRGGGGRP